MRLIRFATVDVFTDRPFAGNPLAVVLDAQGLTSSQMQAIAREFNYIESTFVLPPEDPAHSARVRIFTPTREIPFAGHPNIGTAFVLAQEASATRGVSTERLTFEEDAGLVQIELISSAEGIRGARLVCPEPFSRGGQLTAQQAAACLGLQSSDVKTDGHPPQVASVGLPFVIVELTSRDALRRASPDKAAFARVLPLDGAHAVYAYTTDSDEPDVDLHARMFTSAMAEDPATGSATAAASALLAELTASADLTLTIRQGVDMGRPSTLQTRVIRESGRDAIVTVGGQCVPVMSGQVRVD